MNDDPTVQAAPSHRGPDNLLSKKRPGIFLDFLLISFDFL